MRKAAAIFLAMILVAGLCPTIASTTVMAAGYGSNGKFSAPIAPPAAGSIGISTRAELEAIRSNGTYHLTADINLSGAEWEPLCLNNPFSGVFDGQGYVIRNLTSTQIYKAADSTGRAYAGLFARTSKNAVIKNVGIEGTNIKIGELGTDVPWPGGYDALAGGICGSLGDSSTISNCYNAGSVSGSGYRSYMGGICGLAGKDVVISDSYNTGNVSAHAEQGHAGGICGIFGANSGGTITNCYNTGNISVNQGNTSTAGGICGYVDFYAFGTVISYCYNTGNVSASSAGGICGESNCLISSCYNTGTVAADRYAGGISGRFDSGYITDCYNTGKISTSSKQNGYTFSAGGICGYSKVYSSSPVTYGVGNPNHPAVIYNCYNAGDISSYTYSGGICGYFYLPHDSYTARIGDCYNIGSITGSSEDGKPCVVGAIVGGSTNSPVNSFWNINATQRVNGEARADSKKVGVGAGTDETEYLVATRFKERATYVNFDFNSIWAINANVNNGYPTLISSSSNLGMNLETASSWAHEGIAAAIGKGFVPTDIQNNYTKVITRAEFCRMAIKWVEYATGKSIDAVLAEKGLLRNPNAFTDTSDPDILAAFALGITSGTGQGVFSPGGQFNREQAATMIMNTCRVIGANADIPPASGFADMGSAANWAINGINFVRANGIMSGTDNNKFSPKANYTREQSIITFNNIKHAELSGK